MKRDVTGRVARATGALPFIPLTGPPKPRTLMVMDADSLRSPRLAGGLRQPQPTLWQKIKKFFVPVGVAGLLLAKRLAQLKFIFLPLLKIAPFFKTRGTMFVTIWLFSLLGGRWVAFCFVLFVLVPGCGHFVAA